MKTNYGATTWWSPGDVERSLGRVSADTVRLAIRSGALPARRAANGYFVIDSEAARTWNEARLARKKAGR